MRSFEPSLRSGLRGSTSRAGRPRYVKSFDDTIFARFAIGACASSNICLVVPFGASLLRSAHSSMYCAPPRSEYIARWSVLPTTSFGDSVGPPGKLAATPPVLDLYATQSSAQAGRETYRIATANTQAHMGAASQSSLGLPRPSR